MISTVIQHWQSQLNKPYLSEQCLVFKKKEFYNRRTDVKETSVSVIRIFRKIPSTHLKDCKGTCH